MLRPVPGWYHIVYLCCILLISGSCWEWPAEQSHWCSRRFCQDNECASRRSYVQCYDCEGEFTEALRITSDFSIVRSLSAGFCHRDQSLSVLWHCVVRHPEGVGIIKILSADATVAFTVEDKYLIYLLTSVWKAWKKNNSTRCFLIEDEVLMG